MEKKNADIWISDILYRYLKGEASRDEETMIRCWLKNERNAEFFGKLSNSDLLFQGLKELQEVDTEGAFANIYRKKTRLCRRRRLVWGIGGVAAVLCVLWMIILPHWDSTSQKVFFIAQEQSALPQDCTILRTPLGKVVYLADTVLKLTPLPAKTENELLANVCDSLPEYNVLSTSKRRMIKVTLSDSSKVWLNAGSVLRYPGLFAKEQRVVYLKGEAYFEVAKNAARPFIVRTGPADIQVVGTSFNLHTNGVTSCVTTLVEGCVKMISPQHDEVTIYANQQVDLNAEGIKVNRVNTGYYVAWKNNCFAFEMKSLRHIAARLSEWYDCHIEFASQRLAELQYSTIIYRYAEVEKVLDIIARTGDFTFSETRPGTFLIQEK